MNEIAAPLLFVLARDPEGDLEADLYLALSSLLLERDLATVMADPMPALGQLSERIAAADSVLSDHLLATDVRPSCVSLEVQFALFALAHARQRDGLGMTAQADCSASTRSAGSSRSLPRSLRCLTCSASGTRCSARPTRSIWRSVASSVCSRSSSQLDLCAAVVLGQRDRLVDVSFPRCLAVLNAAPAQREVVELLEAAILLGQERQAAEAMADVPTSVKLASSARSWLNKRAVQFSQSDASAALSKTATNARIAAMQYREAAPAKLEALKAKAVAAAASTREQAVVALRPPSPDHDACVRQLDDRTDMQALLPAIMAGACRVARSRRLRPSVHAPTPPTPVLAHLAADDAHAAALARATAAPAQQLGAAGIDGSDGDGPLAQPLARAETARNLSAGGRVDAVAVQSVARPDRVLPQPLPCRRRRRLFASAVDVQSAAGAQRAQAVDLVVRDGGPVRIARHRRPAAAPVARRLARRRAHQPPPSARRLAAADVRGQQSRHLATAATGSQVAPRLDAHAHVASDVVRRQLGAARLERIAAERRDGCVPTRAAAFVARSRGRRLCLPRPLRGELAKPRCNVQSSVGLELCGLHFWTGYFTNTIG